MNYNNWQWVQNPLPPNFEGIRFDLRVLDALQDNPDLDSLIERKVKEILDTMVCKYCRIAGDLRKLTKEDGSAGIKEQLTAMANYYTAQCLGGTWCDSQHRGSNETIEDANSVPQVEFGFGQADSE